MKKLIILVLTMIVIGIMSCTVLATQTYQATFYVDNTNGNDSNSGTSPSNAFQTIERAKAAVRTINNDMYADIIVYIRGGEYVLQDTLVFSADDSGTNGHRILYQAYGNESAVISGGRKITGWTRVDPVKNIYRAYVGQQRFRQIYINGHAGIMARSPNMKDAATSGPYYHTSNQTYPFEFDITQLEDNSALTAGEFVFIEHWSYLIAQIENCTVTKNTARVEFNSPQDQLVKTKDGRGNVFFFVQDSYDLLDAPGEWYHNREDGYLYYIPRNGENLDNVEVTIPLLETLIDITGTDQDHPAQRISLKGLTFLYTGWNAPNEFGYFCSQQGQYPMQSPTFAGLVPGMINMKYARAINVEDNVFKNAGGCAIVTQPTSNENRITGNYFYGIASNAISLGVNDSYSDIPNNGGFENGNFSGWTAGSNWTISGQNVRSGNYSATLAGTNSGTELKREISVVPNMVYVASFWSKSTQQVGINVCAESGAVLAEAQTVASGEWTETRVQFNSNNYTKLYFTVRDTISSRAYFDDFNCEKLRDITERYGGSSYDVVLNNYIENCASIYRDGCGIFAQHPNNLTVNHNIICNMPYDAIGFGWSWDDNEADAHGYKYCNYNNEVAYNRISDVMQLLDDGAAIYSLGRSDGSKIHDNYISNITASAYSGGYPIAGIYLDNGSANKTVENNVIENVTNAYYAKNPPNHDNIIRSNFYNQSFGNVAGENQTTANTLVSKEYPTAAKRIMQLAGVETAYRGLGNVAYNKHVETSAGTGGAYLTDGSTTNEILKKWYSATVPNSATVALGDLFEVTKWSVMNAELGGEDPGYNTVNFELQISIDGAKWITADSVAGNTKGLCERYLQKPVFARYARLYITKGTQDTSDNGIRVYEFGVYGSKYTADASTLSGSSIVSIGKATASSTQWDDRYAPEKATDGIVSGENGWSASAQDQRPWWMVDLGAQYRIDKIEIPDRPHYDNGETRRNFEIWASNNSDMNQGHVVLGTLGNSGYPYGGIWTLNVTDSTPYRYIALMKTQSEYMYIEEFRVYGVLER